MLSLLGMKKLGGLESVLRIKETSCTVPVPVSENLVHTRTRMHTHTRIWTRFSDTRTDTVHEVYLMRSADSWRFLTIDVKLVIYSINSQTNPVFKRTHFSKLKFRETHFNIVFMTNRRRIHRVNYQFYVNRGILTCKSTSGNLESI